MRLLMWVPVCALVVSGCAASGEFVVQSESAAKSAAVQSVSPPANPGEPSVVTGVDNPACPSSTPDEGVPASFVPDAPLRDSTGSGLVVLGVVRSGVTCTGLAGARVNIWHEGPKGKYRDRFRSVVLTDAQGRFRYEGPRLKSSDEAEPHVHFLVEVPEGVFPWTTGAPMVPKGQVREFAVDIVVPGTANVESQL